MQNSFQLIPLADRCQLAGFHCFSWDSLGCLAVRFPPQEREMWEFNSCFSQSSHTSALEICTLLATLLGAWHFRTSTRVCSVSKYWLGEVPVQLEGFWPEWCIFTIYHCRDVPFWSGTLNLLSQYTSMYNCLMRSVPCIHFVCCWEPRLASNQQVNNNL